MFVCPPSTDKSPAKTLTYSIHPNFDVVAAAAVMLHLGHGLPEVFRGRVPAQQLTYLVVNQHRPPAIRGHQPQCKGICLQMLGESWRKEQIRQNKP